MSEKQEKWVGIIVSVILVGLLISFFKNLNKKTQTSLISDDGLDALNDPIKKKAIDDAIENSRKTQIQTGIWKNPEVDFK
ncbi:MAG: hypothetical protein FGM14_09835 [Flavobacteriales bacterium]|nr:hypothetical protein [Flavobacteriales bacterium]